MNADSKSDAFGATIPFIEHLGIEMVSFEGGRSELTYTPRPEHFNSFAVAHGGALMTLLDITMVTAARSVDKDMGAVTVEMKTSFMRPAKGALRSQGRLIHRSATMAFTEATLYDDKGQVCAHATGTFKYMNRQATGSRSVTGLDVIKTD